jgi:hypothetical protein
MSIYVFISRRADPLDDGGPSITADEWLRAADDESFRDPSNEEKSWLGTHARIWLGNEYTPAFDWVDGQIEVKAPDNQTIAKMHEIAHRLRANLFSETGEMFDVDGKHSGFLAGFP